MPCFASNTRLNLPLFCINLDKEKRFLTDSIYAGIGEFGYHPFHVLSIGIFGLYNCSYLEREAQLQLRCVRTPLSGKNITLTHHHDENKNVE